MKKLVSKTDIPKYHGQRVIVVGRYLRHWVKKGSRSLSALPERAIIRLSDSTDIMLYPFWNSNNMRESQELAKFENKVVHIVGIINDGYSNLPDDAIYQSFSLPYLTEIDSITTDF